MVSCNAFFVRENWVKEGRAAIHCLEPSLAAPKSKSKSAMSSQDGGGGIPPRRRESRSGTRKVATLSAEQLERKRANDREAQRSIRQRTKEHIEQLETEVSLLRAQVAELRSRDGQFQKLLERNAALEDEVSRLKHQLAYPGASAMAATGEQMAPSPYRGGWNLSEGPGSMASSIPTTPGTVLPPSQFSGSSHPSGSMITRARSAVSVSSHSSHPQDWQQYTTTRSASMGEASESELPGRMESYVMEGNMQQGPRLAPPPSIAVATPQISFSGNTAPPVQQSAEASFQQVYPGAHEQVQRSNTLQSSPQSSIDHHDVQVASFLPSQRNMPFMPSVTAAAQPASAQSYQPSEASYQNPLTDQRDRSYPYPWGRQS